TFEPTPGSVIAEQPIASPARILDLIAIRYLVTATWNQSASHVGEDDGDLFALALQRAASGEDFLREVLRRVGARVRCRSCLRRLSERLPALTAKLYAACVLEAAAWATHDSWPKGRAARELMLSNRPLRALRSRADRAASRPFVV